MIEPTEADAFDGLGALPEIEAPEALSAAVRAAAHEALASPPRPLGPMRRIYRDVVEPLAAAAAILVFGGSAVADVRAIQLAEPAARAVAAIFRVCLGVG